VWEVKCIVSNELLLINSIKYIEASYNIYVPKILIANTKMR
jgi:hypothetical protein